MPARAGGRAIMPGLWSLVSGRSRTGCERAETRDQRRLRSLPLEAGFALLEEGGDAFFVVVGAEELGGLLVAVGDGGEAGIVEDDLDGLLGPAQGGRGVVADL